MRRGLTPPRPRSYNTRCVAKPYKLPRWVIRAIRKQAPIYGSPGRAGLPVSGTATVLPASGGLAFGRLLLAAPGQFKPRTSRDAVGTGRHPLALSPPRRIEGAPGTRYSAPVTPHLALRPPLTPLIQ